MGLDITAYKRVEFVRMVETDEDWDEARPIAFCLPKHFPGWQDDIVDGGIYDYMDSMSFRAGSYSGYNAWRAWLCRMALGVDPETVWANEEEYKDKPFFYLINFSDCEGVIGPEKSKILAKDFAAYKKKVKEQGDGEYYELYLKWQKAFKMASQNGFVDFH